MRSVGFFMLWLVGSAVAVSVAFAGIALVDDELIDPPPAQVSNLANQPSSIDPAPAVLGNPESPATSAPTRATPLALPTEAVSSVPADSPTARIAAPTATPVPPTRAPSTPVPSTPVPATPVPPTTAPSTPVPATAVPSTPVPTTATSPIAPLPTRVPSTPVPPTAVPTPSPLPEPQAQVVTFNLVGGSTAISFSESVVEVLWASPNPGFEVDIDPGSNLRVEFESDDHRSRLDATWSAGPQHEIREDDR